MKEKINANKDKWLKEITKQKEIQSTLKSIIHSTDDAISVVDEKGLHTIINPAYTRLTGLTEEDVLGKSPTIDIADGGESMHLKVLRTGKPVHGVRMRVGPNRKEVIVNVAPVIVDGVLKGSVAVIHDVSEIKYLNEELERVKERVRHLESKYTFADIVGESRGMIIAKEQAMKAAQTPATVLLQGESGTGKELFAHAIHHASKRNNRQFFRVNCSALVNTLLESELFYIPPLRERKEDMPLLVNNLIRKYNQDFGRNVKGILPEALNILLDYAWPGNVRELENVIERAVINMKLSEESILPKHIPPLINLYEVGIIKEKLISDSKTSHFADFDLGKNNLKNIKDLTERIALINALKSTNGDSLKTAKKLGISLRSFYYKIKKYNIKKIYECK